jgi:hypothetical protein
MSMKGSFEFKMALNFDSSYCCPTESGSRLLMACAAASSSVMTIMRSHWVLTLEVLMTDRSLFLAVTL